MCDSMQAALYAARKRADNKVVETDEEDDEDDEIMHGIIEV